MCGISGIVLKSGEMARQETLESMANAMRNRGPDSGGFFSEQNTGLSHRRLKIIDLSDAANQPMFNSDGRIAVVFNGEIYNFAELRTELQNLGHHFKNRSDTEVIVHAFERWGTDSFLRFNGMFAFALWDGRAGKSKLYLVRDRLGIKPLFYSLATGRLAFASELKPLLQLPWIQKRVNPRTLYHFLKFSHVPNPDSIIEDVSQLKPGHWLLYENGNAKIQCFWDPLQLSHRGNRSLKVDDRSEPEWLERFDQVLRRAVHRQLVSDVPIGCFLSGGIDSTLLALTHASLGSGKLQTFSIGYRESEFDETPFARQVAQAIGTEHHEWIAEPKDFFDIIPDVPDHFDQPLGDPTLLSSLLLSKFARTRVTVALSGDGGDELFFGYPYQQVLSKLQFALQIPHGLRTHILEPIRALASITPTSRSYQIAKAAETLQAKDEAELFQYFVGTFGPLRLDRVAALVSEPVSPTPPVFQGLVNRMKDLPWNDKIQQVFMQTFLPDTVLAKTDRAGMAYGLEARVPFLDDEIAEFSAELPFEWKRRNHFSKYLLRKSVEAKLPGSISHRKKQGFSIPLREWFRQDLKYLLDEYLHPARLKREGTLNAAHVNRLVKGHLSGQENHSHLLWSLVCFQMWKERHLS